MTNKNKNVQKEFMSAFKPPYTQKPVKTYTDGGKKKVMPVHGQKWV